MNTPDLFPAELAAAQRELAESEPRERAVDDDYTADDKREAQERYWYWDDSAYARQVCQRRWGEL